MDTEYLKDHDVINRYVLNQLSERELIEFELYFLEHPDVLDEVEEVYALKEGLIAHREQLLHRDESESIPPPFFATLMAWFQRPTIVVGNAAIIVALTVALLVPSPPVGDAQIASHGKLVWIGNLRGEPAPLKLQLDSPSLVFDIEVGSVDSYAVTLKANSGKVVSRVESVTPVAGALIVVFDTSELLAGSYQLVVTRPDGTAAVRRNLELQRSD